MKSIRSFLLTRLLGGAAVILVGAGAAVYFVVVRSLNAQFDANLADRVQGFASILFQQEDEVHFEFSEQLMPEYARAEAPAYFELRFRDGRLLERSDSLGTASVEVPGVASSEPLFWSAALPDGRRGRFVAQLIEVHHLYPEEGPDRPTPAEIRVVIARGPEDLAAAKGKLLVRSAALSLGLLGLLGVVSWIAVDRGLAPANRLAARLDEIRVDALPSSLGVGRLPAELAPMGEKADALIRRVADALERERRTTADIAHELRTPISELLTVSEVALRNGHDPADASRALGRIRDVAWRMGRAVVTLLKLARLDMGAETFDETEVDLGALVADSLRSLAAVERERRLAVENRVPPRELVTGDPEVLRIVISNLLSNALFYAPESGAIECRVERDGEGWRLVVENDAEGLDAADLSALSEPFWRKERADADREHAGLGLALSRTLALTTGSRLDFALIEGRFRATLSHDASADRARA